jgi:hypothetical protein
LRAAAPSGSFGNFPSLGGTQAVKHERDRLADSRNFFQRPIDARGKGSPTLSDADYPPHVQGEVSYRLTTPAPAEDEGGGYDFEDEGALSRDSYGHSQIPCYA